VPDRYKGIPVQDLWAGVDERKTELCDIAIRMIADQGFMALTFRNLAEAAGTSTMTFSYAFKSREQMIETLIDRVYSRTWRERGFDRDDDENDPLGKLRLATNVALQNSSEFDPFQRVLDRFVLEAPYSEKTKDKTNALDDLVEIRYIRLINLAREQGQISPVLEPSDIVQLLWSVGDGLNTQRYAHVDYFPPERMNRLYFTAFDFVLGVPSSAASPGAVRAPGPSGNPH
jgi:AcrR family transcriptional regulator